MKRHARINGSELPREMYKVINNHHQFYHNMRRFPTTFATREFITENFWRKEHDGSFVIVFKNASALEDPPARKQVTGAVTKGSATFHCTIMPLSSDTCRATIVTKGDPGGVM
jgi:hypothetical protein